MFSWLEGKFHHSGKVFPLPASGSLTAGARVAARDIGVLQQYCRSHNTKRFKSSRSITCNSMRHKDSTRGQCRYGSMQPNLCEPRALPSLRSAVAKRTRMVETPLFSSHVDWDSSEGTRLSQLGKCENDLYSKSSKSILRYHKLI